MLPSRWSTSSTLARSFEAGERTESFFACWPLRMRVSISPRGSVIAIALSLPARLGHARDHALVGEIPECDPVEAELAIIAARAAGGGAAVAHAGGIPVARDFRQLEARDQPRGIVERVIVGDRLQLRVTRRVLLHEPLAPLVLVHRTQFRHGLKLFSWGGLRRLLFFSLRFRREREPEQPAQLARFVVGVGSGGDDDVNPTHFLDAVVADLRVV